MWIMWQWKFYWKSFSSCFIVLFFFVYFNFFFFLSIRNLCVLSRLFKVNRKWSEWKSKANVKLLLYPLNEPNRRQSQRRRHHHSFIFYCYSVTFSFYLSLAAVATYDVRIMHHAAKWEWKAFTNGYVVFTIHHPLQSRFEMQMNSKKNLRENSDNSCDYVLGRVKLAYDDVIPCTNQNENKWQLWCDKL